METIYVAMVLKKELTIVHPATGELFNQQVRGMAGYFPVFQTYEQAFTAADFDDTKVVELCQNY